MTVPGSQAVVKAAVTRCCQESTSSGLAPSTTSNILFKEPKNYKSRRFFSNKEMFLYHIFYLIFISLILINPNRFSQTFLFITYTLLFPFTYYKQANWLFYLSFVLIWIILLRSNLSHLLHIAHSNRSALLFQLQIVPFLRHTVKNPLDIIRPFCLVHLLPHLFHHQCGAVSGRCQCLFMLVLYGFVPYITRFPPAPSCNL